MKENPRVYTGAAAIELETSILLAAKQNRRNDPDTVRDLEKAIAEAKRCIKQKS